MKRTAARQTDVLPFGFICKNAAAAVRILNRLAEKGKHTLTKALPFPSGWDSTRGLKNLPPAAFLRTAVRRPVRTLTLLAAKQKRHQPCGWCFFCFGGNGGIRTHGRFHSSNDFELLFRETFSVPSRVNQVG